MKPDTEVQEQPRGHVASLLDGFVDDETLSDLDGIGKAPIPPTKNQPAKNQPAKNTAPKEEQEDEEQEEEQEENEQNEGKPGDKNKKIDKKSDKVEGKKSTKNTDPDEDEEEETEDEEEQEEEDAPELKNKFGIKLPGKKDDKKPAKLDIKTFDELPAILKSKYGQDIKSAKALPKFLETVDKWRSDSQNLEKAVKEKDNAMSILENLPTELMDAVKMHYNGQDFRNAFDSGHKIDFSKPADKHKPKTLVNAFFPGEFTDEDFDADEPSRELKIAIKASEKEYNVEKNTREQRAKDHVQQAERKSKAYKESVRSSVTALKSAFPNMGEDVQADVEATLSSGAVMSEFFNPDGTYKPEAAKRFMLAKNGEDLIEDLMKIAELRGESNANEEMVRRAPSKPKPKKAGGKNTDESKETTDRLEQLLPTKLFNKRTF